MKNSQQWVQENCKFAVYEERPERAPHLVYQPEAPQSEDELMQQMDASDNAYIQRNAVFTHLAQQVSDLQMALDLVGNPNYPSFSEAFEQAFGGPDTTQAKEVLNKLQAYFKFLEAHPKFAEKPFVTD